MRPQLLVTGRPHRNDSGRATINCCCETCQYACCIEISEGVFECQTLPESECLAAGGTPHVRYGWGHSIIDGKACCTETEECQELLNPLGLPPACVEDEDCGAVSYPGCPCCEPPVLLPDTITLAFPSCSTVPTTATWPGGFPCAGMGTACYRKYIDYWAGLLVGALAAGVTLARVDPPFQPGQGCQYSGLVTVAHGNQHWSECNPGCNAAGTVSVVVSIAFFDGSCSDGILSIALTGQTSGGAIQYVFMDDTIDIPANTDCDWAQFTFDPGIFGDEIIPAEGVIDIEL